MIEHAMRAEVLSASEFCARVAVAFVVWHCVELLARIYMARRWRGAPETTSVEVRQCIVSCTHATWSLIASALLAASIEHPFGASAALTHIPHRFINPVGVSFFGYLLWDVSLSFRRHSLNSTARRRAVRAAPRVVELCAMGHPQPPRRPIPPSAGLAPARQPARARQDRRRVACAPRRFHGDDAGQPEGALAA